MFFQDRQERSRIAGYTARPGWLKCAPALSPAANNAVEIVRGRLLIPGRTGAMINPAFTPATVSPTRGGVPRQPASVPSSLRASAAVVLISGDVDLELVSRSAIAGASHNHRAMSGLLVMMPNDVLARVSRADRTVTRTAQRHEGLVRSVAGADDDALADATRLRSASSRRPVFLIEDPLSQCLPTPCAPPVVRKLGIVLALPLVPGALRRRSDAYRDERRRSSCTEFTADIRIQRQ